eukprot:gene23304-30210_t
MNSALKISSLLLLIGSCITTSTAPKPLPICQYSGYCRVNSDCYPGNKCIVQNPQYSQCLPDSTQYSSIVGCLANNLVGVQCSDSTICCDPGATCNNKAFRQCSQPESTSLLCRDPLNFGNSTGFPMISPTASPSTQKPTNPTNPPTILPTPANSVKPVGTPSKVPTTTQTLLPSSKPSAIKSAAPIVTSKNPSVQPASAPSGTPLSPTNAPISVVNSISPVTKTKNCTQPTFPNCSIPSSYNAAVASPTATPLSSGTPVSKAPVSNPSTLPSTKPVVSSSTPVA